MKLLLAVLPYFQNSSFMIPHLGNACISAYLKQKSNFPLEIKCLDLRILPETVDIWGPSVLPQITFKNLYVSDIYDLPLLTSLIDSFNKNRNLKSILEPVPEVVARWSLERAIYPDTVTEKLRKAHYFAMKNLPKFDGYDIVGFSTYTTNLYLSVFMALLIRLNYPGTKIIFGGPQITQGETTRELLIKGGVADFLVLGEGEQPMFELLTALKSGEDINSITGLKTSENFSQSDTFAQNADLETLPVPDFSATDFPAYTPSVIPVYSNRGCPFRCHFCSEHSLFGKKFKRRSPQRVMADMEELAARYGLYEFTISDSLINSSEEWLEEFTELLLKNDKKFGWGGYFRAEMPDELITRMKKAGLTNAILGVESFSQATLKNMNKRKVKQEILDTINSLVKNEVHAFVNLFVGYPGEKDEDFMDTLNIAREFYLKFKNEGKEKYFRVTARNFQLRPFSTTYNYYSNFGLEANSWKDYYPESQGIFENIYQKTLCSFKVNDVELDETWHRVFLMKQLKGNNL